VKDFFISYTSADRSWADWIAWTLQDVGYTTIHQAWDFRPGSNFVTEMKDALQNSDHTIAVYSPNYFTSGFGEDEWTAAFADRSLLGVRVRDCDIPKLLRPRVYIDLLTLNQIAARDALLSGVKREGAKPSERPEFPPDADKPKRFPGAPPDIFDVPLPRNPNFTGRDQMLHELHRRLQSGGTAALTAISGLGGVGKTQLALEYAYRYASEYKRVFWLRSEEPSTLASEYAGIAARLKLAEKDLANQSEIVTAVRDWLAHNSGWLLVFDNATGPEACTAYIPRPNTGHILITSRHTAWRGVADPMGVQQLSREESVAFLKKRTGRDETESAGNLSEALGDLPLALEHAAAYIEAADISIGEYITRLRAYPKKLLAPIEATFRISLDKLRSEAPPAIDLLNLIAWFAPDNIPRDLLQPADADQLEFDDSVAALRRYSLIQTAEGVIGVHRLVQEVTRNGLDDAEQKRWAEAAVKLVNDAFPMPLDYRNWPACAKLLPHALQVTEHGERLSVRLEAVTRLLNDAGLYEQERTQLRSAGSLLRRALEVAEKVYGPEHPEVAIRANNIGLILKDQGDLVGALEYTRRALAIDEKIYGRDHPNVARVANNLGQILQAQGDLEGALEYTRRALVIEEKVHGREHPQVAIYANNIGTILKDQGDLAGAVEYTRRALVIDEKVYGPDHPMVAILANNIGQILQGQSDLAGALEYTRRALEIDEKVYGPDHPKVAIRANNIGQILKAQGDLAGALQYMRRALRIFEATYGPDNPTTKITAENLRLLEAKIARP
jgi:tetratricopeptide (TPR) repeat protein